MRKNQRWASAAAYTPYPLLASHRLNGSEGVGGSGMSQAASLFKGRSGDSQSRRRDESPGLMEGFAILKMRLRDMADTDEVDAAALLQPFLEVVRSPETSGPITATALSSIDKFITFSVLTPSSPNLAIAMAQLSSAGTHCKFEASDSVSDEVVLLKILDVLRNCLTGRLGQVLSDESVCEMMETGLSMCCQMRLSEMLRRSAERTMQAMVAAVFSRLRYIPAEDDDATPDGAQLSSNASMYEVSADQSAPGGPKMAAPDPRSAKIPAAGPATPTSAQANAEAGRGAEDVSGRPAGETVDEEVEIAPFGLASIQELLRVLISLLNPHDQQHTDTMRLMALGLLNIAFEVGGRSIGKFPTLRMMVADHLCKHLFQLARSDHPQILPTSLRVITNIFDTMRSHLKLQQELFLSFLLDRLILPNAPPNMRKADLETELDRATWALDSAESTNSARPSTPLSGSVREKDRDRIGPSAESRALMLEILGHFVRGKYSMVDLWVNYDCNIEGEDLYERLIKFMSRGVYPQPQGPSYQQDSSQMICLDTLLDLVAHMAARLDEESDASLPAGLAEEVAKSKANKRILLEGAAAFNLKPKVGLKFLEEHGIIYNDPSMPRAESLARFFKTTPRLDKRLLGDFISRPDQLDVLRAFMHLMDFEGKIICDAMRELLEAFRLPGESQQINRIAETFAEVYFATQPPEIKSQDATYVLAYSVIMLNTDLHSPQVRKRMDLEAYSRNLRGVNDSENFDPEYLRSIYESIRKREIVLPEEHQNQVGFEYGWKELLRRARRNGPLTSNPTNAFDRGMFAIAWKPIVSATCYAFASFRDDYMIQRAIGSINHCAALAARFDMPEVFDFLILSLSRVSGLVPASAEANEVGNFPVVEIEGQKITVSPLAVRFGMNVKAQLAAVVLFAIANNNGRSIRKGWSQIFEIYQTLFTHSLLPPSMLMMEDFLSGTSAIPLKPKTAPTPREERRGDGGLLSTLSSYLLSPYGPSGDMAGTDFTDDDVETTLSAVDCIASCHIDELYSQIFDLKGDVLIAPVQILFDLVHRITIDRVRTRSGSGSVPNSPQININASRVQLPPTTFDFLSRLIAHANSFSSLFNERVVAALLHLIVEVIKIDELRDSCFLALDTLRSLSPPVLSSVAEPLMAGLSRVFLENAARVHSTTEWNLLFALFSATAQQEEAAKISMDLLRQLASGQLGTNLHADNYAAFLQTLAGFAHVAPSNKASDNTNDEATLARGLQIVDVLREVQASIPNLIATSTLSPARAWEAAWIPLLSAYAQLCLNPARELRQSAITSLQRTLLAPEILQNDDVDLTIIFERVFFPLLEELLKPQVFRRDPEGMGETRLRASALLCKIFLQYLTQLSERQGMLTMTELWLKILGYEDRFMHSGRRDQMYEAVPELLKNVLLVMNASGFLLPPCAEGRTEAQARLFDLTFNRIEPFLPELQRELFPPPRVPVPFSHPSARTGQPPAPPPPAPSSVHLPPAVRTDPADTPYEPGPVPSQPQPPQPQLHGRNEETYDSSAHTVDMFGP
ncbi:sec7 domain-containing protein [Rhodotorula toruloides]|uniref:Sec7 domain-containing protein n=1 Tax=Rhodotorula toruloides TaxID=5286 RepID=A0A511KRZ3_RHOTO|nr:sec7 domain-containing protein [Rhodotorula toruloides]